MPVKNVRGEANASPRVPGRDIESGPLKEILCRIGEKGRLSFAEFMDVALYWYDGGYYASAVNRWAEAGDYITNVDISPVFSRLIARQVSEMWEKLGRPAEFTLVEAGAGRGLLSKGIDKTLEEICPVLHSLIKIRLVEINPNLHECVSPRITWHKTLDEIPGPMTGCILSNELFDSFPVHRFVFDGGLKEIYTGYGGRSFVDIAGPPSTPLLEGYFERAGVRLVEGQRGEINLKAMEWVKKAAALLETGFVITIDYGLPACELYAPERRGTLLCHYRHTLNDNPFVNIGDQDITSHVDFTALKKTGEENGLYLTGFTTQKNFLLGLGIAEELKESDDLSLGNLEKISHNRNLSRLIMPGGAGDVFKVLIQHKGADRPALKGFSFRDMSSYL
ncbi:MAG: SAM-dependent methyltransferase [Deltaproteobacteria bacterium]|nr:SAM-dependent methyltransferase [Deltaproteobacteria bacterium]